MLERRITQRARVNIPVRSTVDGFDHECRALEISARGMLLERTLSLAEREPPMLTPIAFNLGGSEIRCFARTVWGRDRLHAVRFVALNDVDRLTIAEALDALEVQAG